MVILIKNGRVYAVYPDTTDIIPSDGYESIIVAPDNLNLSKLYRDAGFDPDTAAGLLGLPNPLEIENFFPVEELNIVRKRTASFNRVLRENNGIIWNDSRHKIDTKTCQSLVIAVLSIQSGTITPPLAWRDADGNFATLGLTQLQELAGVVMHATEENFKQEEIEST